MQWPDQMPGAENVHAAWRMGVAERAAGVHAGNRNLAALAVAGSVGAGIADRFSDLELDCYWVRPPADADRLGPVRALGGELIALWDYDQDDQEWSEDYLVGELGITVSNFLVSSVEQFLDDVLVRGRYRPRPAHAPGRAAALPPASRHGDDGILAGTSRYLPPPAGLGTGATGPCP